MAKRVVVIGATGHVGSFLVPRLVEAGCDVVGLSRGAAKPYVDDKRWGAVEQIIVDRAAAEADGTFVHRVRELKPDITIDIICFEPERRRWPVGFDQQRL